MEKSVLNMAVPDKSPCLKCFRLNEDKNACSENCDELRVFKGLPPAMKTRHKIGPAEKTATPIFVGNEKRPLPQEKGDKIRRRLKPAEVEMTVVKKEEVTGRLCKNGDGRPAHKTSPYCLECCRENFNRNRQKAKERPQVEDIAINAEEKLFNQTLETLPAFDPAWPQEVWERYLTLWSYLWDIARDLDGVERPGG